jgi:hypothetical protein
MQSHVYIQICSKIKNLCQTCILDLELGNNLFSCFKILYVTIINSPLFTIQDFHLNYAMQY